MEPIREANVQTQPGKRLAEEPKQKKGGKGWKIALGAVVLAAVACFSGACCMLANNRSTFFPHTTVNGVEVGGLTVAGSAGQAGSRNSPERMQNLP